jgi:hypothetical protein
VMGSLTLFLGIGVSLNWVSSGLKHNGVQKKSRRGGMLG